MEIRPKSGQTLIGIAAKYYGSVFSVFRVLQDNPSLTGVSHTVTEDDTIFINDSLVRRDEKTYPFNDTPAIGLNKTKALDENLHLLHPTTLAGLTQEEQSRIRGEERVRIRNLAARGNLVLGVEEMTKQQITTDYEALLKRSMTEQLTDEENEELEELFHKYCTLVLSYVP